MKKITFTTDKYGVGIDEIDKQHERLFDILNNVIDAKNSMFAKPQVAIALHDLLQYTKEHFNAEEKFLEEAGYPQIDEHKQKHRVFIKQVNDFIMNFGKNRAELNDEIVQFLTNWTTEHILDEDQKYARFIKT